MRIVLASNNPGKARELNALLKNFAIDLIAQSHFDVPEAEETGLTFIENALIKARHAAELTGLPALADDSGLSILALGGAPGVYSARFAGPKANANDNIQKVLHEMRDIPFEKRQANFHCVLALMSHAEDPTPLVCEGKWSGIILPAPQGQKGFGYDPIFYVPSEKKSAAELSLARKNEISHRAIALQALVTLLPRWMER